MEVKDYKVAISEWFYGITREDPIKQEQKLHIEEVRNKKGNYE